MIKNQTKNLIVIIDFDDVLFDRKGKFSRACKKAGVDLSSGNPLYEKVKMQNNGVYDFKEHLRLIAGATDASMQKLEQNMEKVFKRAPDFLFKGAVDALEYLRNMAEKMILISRGNLYFQKKKILNSGIEKFFDEVIISEKIKAEVLAEQITKWRTQNKTIMFIDDSLTEIKAVKKRFPCVKGLHIKQGSQHFLKETFQSQFL